MHRADEVKVFETFGGDLPVMHHTVKRNPNARSDPGDKDSAGCTTNDHNHECAEQQEEERAKTCTFTIEYLLELLFPHAHVYSSLE